MCCYWELNTGLCAFESSALPLTLVPAPNSFFVCFDPSFFLLLANAFFVVLLAVNPHSELSLSMSRCGGGVSSFCFILVLCFDFSVSLDDGR